MRQWAVQDIPDVQGRVALITGANSGLGFQTALALAAHGVLACRDLDKARRAGDAIKATVQEASLEPAALDLASLTSVRAFAGTLLEQHPRLDWLFNNAGMIAILRQETKDGFERQLGTNHLGHCSRRAGAASSRPPVRRAPWAGSDWTISTARAPMGAGRRTDRANGPICSLPSNCSVVWPPLGPRTISVAAHPGYATTNLQKTSATVSGAVIEQLFYATLGRVLAQSESAGDSFGAPLCLDLAKDAPHHWRQPHAETLPAPGPALHTRRS